MIFGLFKKDETADLVFVNGRVYTQNADMPWAEAVACKGSDIIYVGNSGDADSFVGADTCVIDMKGGFMLPGLINTHSHPALRVFEEAYISFLQEMDLDEVQGSLSDYILDNPEKEMYFGYGFEGSLLKGMEAEAARLLLDEINNEKPIVLLSAGEETLWINNCALDAVKAAAEEDGLSQITKTYLMHVLGPFDYDEILNKVVLLASEYCDKGFTSIFSAGAPEFMEEVYQDILLSMLQQEVLKQRNFGSLQILRDSTPIRAINRLIEKRTNTTELNGLINCDTLKLVVRSSKKALSISPRNLKELMLEASERSFNIHIDVEDKEGFQECMKAISEVRDSGYRKNIFTVACDTELYVSDQEFSLDDMNCDNVFFQPPTLCEPSDEYAAVDGAASVTEIIDRFTIDAAIALGVNDKIGSIEKGKLADLVIFEENPFDVMKPSLFKKLSASMTIVNGEIAYDSEEDSMQEWYDLMSSQQL
jgi:hypothetical protein